jgi:hypothetical protein
MFSLCTEIYIAVKENGYVLNRNCSQSVKLGPWKAARHWKKTNCGALALASIRFSTNSRETGLGQFAARKAGYSIAQIASGRI